MVDEAALLTERNGTLFAVALDAQRALREALVAAENGNMPTDSGGSIPLGTSQGRWFANVLPLTSGDRRRTGALYSAVAAVFVRKASPASPPPLEALAKTLQAHRKRGPPDRRRHEGERDQGAGRVARADAGDRQDTPPQRLPQDRYCAAERAREADCGIRPVRTAVIWQNPPARTTSASWQMIRWQIIRSRISSAGTNVCSC